MIISKYGKSYDTSDGSEQHLEDSTRRVQSDGQTDKQRWEDDGGRLNDHRPISAGKLTIKPAWSVLSLRDLNEAIRQEQWADNPVRLQQESERMERRRIRALQVEDNKMAATARAERDRYRNAWENT